MHVEGRHPPIVGESQRLRQPTKVRLAAFKQLLAGRKVVDVVVAGGLKQTQVFLHQHLIDVLPRDVSSVPGMRFYGVIDFKCSSSAVAGCSTTPLIRSLKGATGSPVRSAAR